jgi:chromosome segregation ATPase/cytoskeletal protein CcmA (bactofilin family)
MSELSKKSDGRSSIWSSLLRSKREAEEIVGYQEGSLFSEEDLLVSDSAAVSGNLVAPRITVNGLVYGDVGGREVTVGEKGQIWGDVYAVAIQIEPGAKVQGWLTTLTTAVAERLLNGDVKLADLAPKTAAIPPETLAASGLPIKPAAQTGDLSPDDRLNVLRQLQAEAGAALTAHAELDILFQQKLEERAGNAIREAADLQANMTILRQHVANLQDAAEARNEELAARQTELATVRELLGERTVERDELQTLYQERQAEFTDLQERHETLQENFESVTLERQNLSERLSGIESAFQASLQRAAEQEEALIHWQELAETTDHKVADLEKELNKGQQTTKESSQRIEMLQNQKQKLQEAYDQVSGQLREAEQRVDELTQQVSDYETLLEQKLAEFQSQFEGQATDHAVQIEQLTADYEAQLSELREAIANRPPAADEALAELTDLRQKLAKAEGRVTELESYLQRLEIEAKDYFDQLISYKTDLEETRKQLTSAQSSLQERTKQLAEAQALTAEQQDQVDKWKGNVGRMTELLYDAEQRVKDLRQELEKQEATPAEDKQARELLQQRQVQLDASEAEAARYHQELQTQGQRLAEIQAALIEREVSLSRLDAQLQQKNDELSRLKKAAVARIQKLEKALVQASVEK